MKRIVVIILIAFAPIPSIAQGWKTVALNAQVGAFGVHDTFLFIGTSKEILRYTVANGYEAADNGIDFSQGSVTSFASLGNYFFASVGSTEFQSSDNGSQWVHAGTAAPVGSNGVYLFGQYVDPSQIIRSTDSGKDWEVMTNLSVSSYSSIGIDIFANAGTAIWRSTDTGNHWTQLSPPFVGTMTTMGSLLFVVGNGQLIVSSDSGTKWDSVFVDSASVQEHVTCLATDGKNLFAGTTDGVFVSTDIGKTWHQENDGLGVFLRVNLLSVFDTLLFVNATNDVLGSSWYTASRPIREVVDSAPSSVLETQGHDTIEVYPNPATESVTVISGGTSILRVSVLNVLGENVLDESNLRESNITLDLSKIPSGTYFMQIETSNGSVLRKVVIQH